MRRISRRWIVLGTAVVLLTLSPWAGYHLWQRLCGNKPIRFYGQLLDQSGCPVSNAEVIFHISRDTTLAVPIMHFAAKVHEQVTVSTDSGGYFSLTAGYARNFVVDVWVNGICMNERMTPGKGSLSFDYGTVTGQLSIPDTPRRRIAYRLSRVPTMSGTANPASVPRHAPAPRTEEDDLWARLLDYGPQSRPTTAPTR